MSDRFFFTTTCDRCGASLEGNARMMSMFNTQTICMDCAEKERERPDYGKAVEADHAAIKSGNWNFEGIGLRPEK